jgi:hypothetical protein
MLRSSDFSLAVLPIGDGTITVGSDSPPSRLQKYRAILKKSEPEGE